MAMLRAFQRHWLLAVGGGLVLAALVGVAAYYLIPSAKYMAIATLRVKMMRPKILFTTGEQDAEYATFQKTQMALIRSRKVLNNVFKDKEISGLQTVRTASQEYPEVVEWLEKELVVDFANRSEILQISLSGDIPDDLQKIVNKVVESYQKSVLDKEEGDRNTRVETLRELWTRYLKNLEDKRQDLRKLALKTGSDNKDTLAITAQLAHEQIARAESERFQTKSELRHLQAEIKVLEHRSEATEGPRAPSDEAVDAVIEDDPYVQQLAGTITKLTDKYNTLRRSMRYESDPALTAIRGTIASAQKSLADRRQQLRPIVTLKLTQATHSEQSKDLEQLKGKAEVLAKYDEELVKEIESRKSEAGKLNENTLDLQNQQDEVAVLAETAKKVKAEVEAMDVELKAPDRIEVLDKATAPKTRDNGKKLKMSGMAAAGTFGLVLAGVTFWELRARRVGSAEEVARNLGIRLVGSLPVRARSPRRILPGLRSSGKEGLAMMIESIDATRTVLLHAARTESTQVVLITSSVEREGKTSLACNLAASLSRAGRKTLLMDCDLRRSSIHRVLDVPLCPGLSEVLLGEARIDAVICPTLAAELFVIPAGKGGIDAIQALSRTDLHPIFEELKNQFDFVIVDCAPVLPVVDTLLVSQYVDTALLAVLCDVSRLPAVQQAYDRLNNLGVRILGAVVAGTSVDTYSPDYVYSSNSSADNEPAAES
jgi:succinoglycan biosynthesis transport protein ExoP